MANCIVRDWQGKEAGKASLDLKVAKEASALDLMHRAVCVSRLTAVKAPQALSLDPK